MSTRALRKLQRQYEQEKQLAALEVDGVEEDAEGSEEEESIPSIARANFKSKQKNKLNAFQMLEQGDEAEDQDAVPDAPSDQESMRREEPDVSGVSTPQSTRPKRKKKRKPKDKGKEQESSARKKVESEERKQNPNEVDEIDRALQELNMRKGLPPTQQAQDHTLQTQGSDTSWGKEVSKLLAVNSKNLDPTNEMKSLFGSIALERATRNPAGPDEEGRVNLETALDARHSPASLGKELGSLAKRRNIFMRGQENWPLATSGGLGMEFLQESGDAGSQPDSASDFGKHYQIVHNSSYQDTQRQFRQVVESMSADAMIHHLLYNPYHIASLLQVAEIAKHQGDHSVTGDLLERALFAFGRSVHSTFGVSVREGRARLGFDRPASRELYLTIWRYLQNLEMRGTWRTAFEWSKMLLSFNILSDPYGITHTLDQYALRGRQHDAFIDLCSEAAFGKTWSHLPNMQISLALAYHRASQPKLARQKLALAMHRYPYILSHLCSTLDISPLPRSLWGITPSTDAEKLYTELYVTRAKDLWSTPETTALLVEVADTLDSYSQFWKDAPPAPKLEISLEDARHILLLDIPALIALIPRNFRNLPTAQYDVLPPPSSSADAGLTARAPATADGPGQRGLLGYLAELVGAASRGFRGGRTATSAPENHNDQPAPDEEDHEMNNQDLFYTTLANANLSEADQTAILAALAPTDSEDDDEDADPELDEARERRGTRRTLHLPSTTDLSPRADIIRHYRDEERPPPFWDAREPTQVRDPAGARLTPVPDRDAARTGDADINAPLPPDQHRPRPRPTSRSPPPARVPGVAGGPPAPTVEDEDEGEDGGEFAVAARAGAAAATRFINSLPPPRQTQPSTSPPASPNLQQQQQQQQPPTPISPTSTSSTPMETDPQRIQRYLLSTGLSTLQSNTPGAMEEYTHRLRMLRHRDREWTLSVVRQRVSAGNGGRADGEGGEDLVERIRKALG